MPFARSLFSCLLFVLSTVLYAQNVEELPDTNLEKLKQIAAQEEEKFKKDKAEAIEKAKQLSIPIRYSNEKGTYELIRFESGSPVYYNTADSTTAVPDKNSVHRCKSINTNIQDLKINE